MDIATAQEDLAGGYTHHLPLWAERPKHLQGSISALQLAVDSLGHSRIRPSQAEQAIATQLDFSPSYGRAIQIHLLASRQKRQ